MRELSLASSLAATLTKDNKNQSVTTDESAGHKAGCLYKKAGLRRSWKPHFVSLEGTLLYWFKNKSDTEPKGGLELANCHVHVTKHRKLYSFRISHPRVSKSVDLAATSASDCLAWVHELSKAVRVATFLSSGSTYALTNQSPRSSLRSDPSNEFDGDCVYPEDASSSVISCPPEDVEQTTSRTFDVPEEGFPAVPEQYADLIEAAIARVEVDLADEASWDFAGEKSGVKAYTKMNGSLMAVKGVGFLPFHPRAILDLVLDASKRETIDPLLAQGMRLKTVDAQTSIDYLEFKSMCAVAGRDFCNLTHWRVLPDGTIVVVVQSVEDQTLCPLKEPKVVRAEILLACFKIEPNEAYDGAWVTMLGSSDLKGSIPTFIVSKVIAEQPFVIQRIGDVLAQQKGLDSPVEQGKVANTLFERPRQFKSTMDSKPQATRYNEVSGAPEKPTMTTLPPSTIAEATTKDESEAAKVTKKAQSKAEKNAARDVGASALQFGGVLLALEALNLSSAIRFAGVVVMFLIFAWRLHLRPSRVLHKQKLKISMFPTPNSGLVLETLQLDVTKTITYIDERRQTPGCRLTITHIVLRALGEVLSQGDSFTTSTASDKPRTASSAVDVSCLVSLSADKTLGVCRLRRVNEMSLQGICDGVRRRTAAKLEETGCAVVNALPANLTRALVRVFAWLEDAFELRVAPASLEPYRFGQCMVASVGMMGMDFAFSPITPYSRVPMLVTIGAVAEQVVEVAGQMETRLVLTLAATSNQRRMAHVEPARVLRGLARHVEDPSTLEPVPAA